MLTLECLVHHPGGERYFRAVRLSRKEAAFLVARRPNARTHDLVRTIARVPSTDTVEDWRVKRSGDSPTVSPGHADPHTSPWFDPDHTEPEVARLSLDADLTPKNP